MSTIRNFIEVPQKNGSILINVNHIVSVRSIPTREDCTEIKLSAIGQTLPTHSVSENKDIIHFETKCQTIGVSLSYSEVLNLIKEAVSY